jgi:hypothetical protein
MAIPVIVASVASRLAFKGAFWSGIWYFLSVVVGPLAMQLLLSLGVGFVAYTGFSILLDGIEGYIYSYYDALPADLYSLLSIAGFDVGIGMLFGAAAAVLTLKAGNALGNRRRIQPWKKPGGNWEA